MLELIRGKQRSPMRTMLVGIPGVGKSYMAAQTPKPVFLDLEDGIDHLEVDKTPLCTSFAQALDYCGQLVNDKEHSTLVVDSVDWMERLAQEAVCQRHGKDSVSSFGYGEGYDLVAAEMQKFMRLLSSARSAGKHVFLIAHAGIERFENPEGPNYDRWVPKMNKRTCAMVMEWCDNVLFMAFETMVKLADPKKARETNTAVGTDKRWLYCNYRPARVAKNRLGITEERITVEDFYKRVSEYYKKDEVKV